MKVNITATNFKTKEVFKFKSDSAPIVGEVLTTTGNNEEPVNYRVIAKSRTLNRELAIKLKDVNIRDYLDAGDVNIIVVPLEVEETLMTFLEAILMTNPNEPEPMKALPQIQSSMSNYLVKIGWIDPVIKKHIPKC
jgi:hypothetical protein